MSEDTEHVNLGKNPNRPAVYVNMKTCKVGDLTSM